LPQPTQSQSDAYGGWIELTYQERADRRRTDGELVAVSADTVWVLNDSLGVAIPTGTVQSGKLTVFAAHTGDLTAWQCWEPSPRSPTEHS
jgi:hypothetical protein